VTLQFLDDLTQPLARKRRSAVTFLKVC
jgi:hypothetical protein